MDISQLKRIPFQAQIFYFNNAGDNLVRLLTAVVEATDKQEVAMKEVIDIGQVHRRGKMNVINWHEDAHYQEQAPMLSKAYNEFVQQPLLNVKSSMI